MNQIVFVNLKLPENNKKTLAADKVEKAKSDSSQKDSYQEKKAKEKTIRKLEKEIQRSEKKIDTLENEVLSIEKELAETTESNPQELYTKHAEKSKELEQVMEAWERSSTQLEDLK